MPVSREETTAKRDAKVHATMQNLAPLWLAGEEFRAREDSLIFSLIYQSPIDGWVQERFKYDAFNDVLYHMGMKLLTEADIFQILDQEPWLADEVSTYVPNAPNNRLSAPGLYSRM
jgi:hypothetical protein